MYVTKAQLASIGNSPKKACQRGLDVNIVPKKTGDKQVFIGTKPSYMYFNNPIYRVGNEGDPSPEALSSRNFITMQNLAPTESHLHLLYPTIDSGSVFLSQRNMDERWASDRSDVPALPYQEKAIEKDVRESRAYDSAVLSRDYAEEKYDELTRYHAVYDQAEMQTDVEPDGIRHPLDIGPEDLRTVKTAPYLATQGTDRFQSAFPIEKQSDVGTFRDLNYPVVQNPMENTEDIKRLLKRIRTEPLAIVESYKHMPIPDIGQYGNPVSDEYSRTGNMRYGYDRELTGLTSYTQGVAAKDANLSISLDGIGAQDDRRFILTKGNICGSECQASSGREYFNSQRENFQPPKVKSTPSLRKGPNFKGTECTNADDFYVYRTQYTLLFLICFLLIFVIGLWLVLKK